MLSIDCFITTNFKRPYLLSLTERALYLSGFCPILIDKPLLERYFECERLATSDLYILSDDDVIPASRSTLGELIEIMREHPEYSQLGLSWKGISKENPIIRRRGALWELDYVGRLMVIRKGTIKPLDNEFELHKEDGKAMGDIARKQGLKVGIVPNLFFHNLG